LTRKLSYGALAALVIAFFTFGAAVVINRTVFERLPHLEDEFAYLFQAKIYARGQEWVPRNEPVKVFWQPFVIQPESSPDGMFRRFGKYTPGWPLVLAPGAGNNTPWVVNAFMGMLAVAVVYRLGKEIFGEAVGVVAAVLLAISPMALLLNATLMSHTSALFFTMLFIYCYWRTTKIERRTRNLLLWGAGAGVALGWLVAMRPLTAVAMAAPVGLHALSRLLDLVFDAKKRPQFIKTFAPLVLLAVATLPMLGVVIAFNYSVTGQNRSELYTLQWEYDKPGFGEGFGLMPGGHSLEYGWRNFNADFGIWLRDLYGFTLNPTVANYLKDNLGYGVGIGLSGLLIVAGLIAGRKNEWIWLFFELFVAIVIAQLTYWIGSAVYGSAVYSIRYYYEATGGVVLVSAYGIVAQIRAWQTSREKTASQSISTPARRLWRVFWPGGVLVGVLAAFSLIGYTPERLREPLSGWPNGLYGYNKIGQYQTADLNKVRDPGKKVVVIVLRDPNPTVEDNWRDYGALMAQTSPFLDSDVIVARWFDLEGVDEFRARFPDRQVVYQIGEKFYRTLEEAQGTTSAGATPTPEPGRASM